MSHLFYEVKPLENRPRNNFHFKKLTKYKVQNTQKFYPYYKTKNADDYVEHKEYVS